MALMFFVFVFFYWRFNFFFSITEKCRCEDKLHKNAKQNLRSPNLTIENPKMRICVKCCEANLFKSDRGAWSMKDGREMLLTTRSSSERSL